MTATKVPRLRELFIAASVAAVAAAAACNGSVQGGDNAPDAAPVAAPDAQTGPTQWDEALASREVDYGHALRIASLRLVGSLPTLAEIKFVTDAVDPASAYEATIDAYLGDPRFARQMRYFFRDSFRIGGSELDSAPNFAAQLVVEDRSFLDLFTATTDTCPTYDAATGTFAAASCDSGAPATAGVLTDPNVMRHFYSNMAFRRVRWVQETFACTKFPAEFGDPQDVGGSAQYTSPWAFDSIAGAETGGVIDFRDTSAVICANCHTTMNHQAPLFAHFGEDGRYNADMVVPTPAEGAPIARLADFLVDGETMAWRLGEPVTDLTGLGAALASDPAVAECMVARTWNFAMGKGDIVNTLALVPGAVVQAQITEFQTSGFRLKEVFRSVFTSDDFVKF